MQVKDNIRICMIYKHTTVRKAYGMCYKQNVDFFACIGLEASKWWFYFNMWGIYTIKEYVEQQKHRNKVITNKHIQKQKNQGKEYFTKERLKKMDYAFSRQSKYKLNKK